MDINNFPPVSDNRLTLSSWAAVNGRSLSDSFAYCTSLGIPNFITLARNSAKNRSDFAGILLEFRYDNLYLSLITRE